MEAFGGPLVGFLAVDFPKIQSLVTPKPVLWHSFQFCCGTGNNASTGEAAKPCWLLVWKLSEGPVVGLMAANLPKPKWKIWVGCDLFDSKGTDDLWQLPPSHPLLGLSFEGCEPPDRRMDLGLAGARSSD